MDKESVLKLIADEIIALFDKGRLNPNILDITVRRFSSRFGLSSMPKRSEIIPYVKEKGREDVVSHIVRKPIRTMSGVSPIAVMVRPEGSCRWACIYCPFSKTAPKSYTGYEPAARRARMNNFDPYKQVKTRLKHYSIQGHPADKCEVIIMGGTFLAMDEEYKRSFVLGIYHAFNDRYVDDFNEAKRLNEKAEHRIVGLTIETRPDVASDKHIDEMLLYGATRVELGVQHPDDNIYKIINRGHTVRDVIDATERLKNAGFKIVYHIMPGLPGSNPDKDIEMVKEIFSNPSFKPDMLKIYPTLVMPGTRLYEMYKKGEYAPYNVDLAADVISKFYKYIPWYVRVMRIQRDIPTNLVFDGVKKSNLRQIVESKIREKGIHVKEIRYREPRNSFIPPLSDMKLFITRYKASNSEERFISFESHDRSIIYGLLRLRLSGGSHREEIDEGDALVRELHVYGKEVVVGGRSSSSPQHRGIGAALLSEAERIAKDEWDSKRITIISGPGVRPYYRMFGYSLLGPYMSKRL